MILLIAAAFAQSSEPVELQDDVRIVYPSSTHIDFEEINVGGEIVKPIGVLTLQRTKAKFNPLIPLRDHFNDELAHSTNDVR